MKIEQTIEIGVSPEEAWDRLADPVALARLDGDVLSIRSYADAHPPHEGARYRLSLKVGAAVIGSDVIIVEYTRPRELAWKAITGVDHRVRLRVRPTPNGSKVTIRFSYDTPGIFGTLVDSVSFPGLRSTVHGMLAGAKQLLEGDPERTMPRMSIAERLVHEAGNIAVLTRAGIIAPMRPDKLAQLALAAKTWGLSIGTALTAGAIRHPDRTVIVDDFGSVTYAAADRRTDSIAAGLADLGISEGDAVGVMTRNHRGFLDAVAAVAKVGGDVLLLNTAFSGPQIVDVCHREHPIALIYDREFEGVLEAAREGRHAVYADPATRDPDRSGGTDTAASLDALAAAFDGQRPPPPERSGRLTILTSGTTGTPKGASRGAVSAGSFPTLEAPAAVLERIPMRAQMRIGLAAPAFHSWGLANLLLGLALGATIVMRRRFDPQEWLAEIARSHVEALVVVPVMLQRILELDEEVLARHHRSSLSIVSASGSALSPELADRWMSRFGENLYNLYGSTEVANAAIATPQDMRAAPGTVGRPTRGTTVKLFDDEGNLVPQGAVGRIFVGNAQLFEGYSGGGDKQRLGGLMASGDLGRFDEAGRLFVVGRDDEMIVSGGENVFPKEVEETIARHPAVADVTCIGVDDEKFGRRLRAFVVLRAGMPATADELQTLVREQLARYKVPRDIEFLDELPRNATGKVVKRLLIDPPEQTFGRT